MFDVIFKNLEVRKYEKEDLMFGIDGSKYFVELWVGDVLLDDYKMFLMNGDLEGLGYIIFIVGIKEILYFDVVKFFYMLNDKGIKY